MIIPKPIRSFGLLLAFVCASFSWLHAHSLADKYINRFRDIAVSEMHRAGVPASIKLAQGLLESDWGRSNLAREANNHFGIKCGSRWDGKTFYKYDDDRNKKGELIQSCFRQYTSPEHSFMAHSDFLSDPRKKHRYGFLFELDPTDYKSWAKGLKKAGYATDPAYPKKLIQIIEQYELYAYDMDESPALASVKRRPPNPEISNNTSPAKPRSTKNRTRAKKKRHGKRYIVIEDQSTVADVAQLHQVPVKRILEFNEALQHSSDALVPGSIVYLQKKSRRFSGNKKEHVVQSGETLYDISQQYGIQLDVLYAQNRLPKNSEPLVGEKIRLRGYVHWGKRPKFREKSATEQDDYLFDDESFLTQDKAGK